MSKISKLVFSAIILSYLNSCSGGSSAATTTSGGGESVTTTTLSNLDASNFKGCTYFGYRVDGSNCVDTNGNDIPSASILTLGSNESTNNGNTVNPVFSALDFIRDGEGNAILAAQNKKYDGSYEYQDSNDNTISGNVEIALIGSGIGISSDALSSSTSQIDTSDYITGSDSGYYGNFISDSTATGYSQDLTVGLSGTNDNNFAFATTTGSSANSVYADPAASSTYTPTTSTVATDYIKNIEPGSSNNSSANNVTEISGYAASDNIYSAFSSDSSEFTGMANYQNTGYGMSDFISDCETVSSSYADCHTALINDNYSQQYALEDNSGAVEFKQLLHDIDYFIFEGHDSANGTALASIMNGPSSNTASGETFSTAIVSEAQINSYKTMFDYGKYFALSEMEETEANSFAGNVTWQVNNYQSFGLYQEASNVPDATASNFFTYADQSILDGNDTRTQDNDNDGNLFFYYTNTNDTALPEMFLLQDSTGYQDYQATLEAIGDGNNIVLYNTQFRNEYYDKNDSGNDDINVTYDRNDDLNIFTYSTLAAFRSNDTTDGLTSTNSGPNGNNPEYVVERDFISVAEVDQNSSDYDDTNYYDDIINTITGNTGSTAFVMPTDPSLIKMAVMSDNSGSGDLNVANSTDDSSTDVDEREISANYKNFLFVASVNASYYTTTSDPGSVYTEYFDNGLDKIDQIVLTTSGDANSNYLANDGSVITASITESSGNTTDTNRSLLEEAINTYGSSDYASWDCSGLTNCMIVPGNVYANTKYDRYTAYDSMDDDYIPFLDNSTSSNELDASYFVHDQPTSSSYSDGVQENENLATAYVSASIAKILGAYREEYDTGVLTMENIVEKMLTYATPASLIVGCDANSSDAGVIDCGVGMLNMDRTLSAACNDDTVFDSDGSCTVTVGTASSSANIELSSLNLSPAFGNSLSSGDALGIISQAVYYDDYNFEYKANLDSKITTDTTNYALKDYLELNDSRTEYERVNPTANFSFDLAHSEYDRVYENGSTTRYFNGPVDQSDLNNVSFTNYSFNTNLTPKSSFTLAMDSTSTNSLSPSYFDAYNSAVSFSDNNSYFALTGSSVDFSKFSHKLNKFISFDMGFASDANVSFDEASNLMFQNLNFLFKDTSLTFSFGSLIEPNSFLDAEGNEAFAFNEVNTTYYGASIHHKLTNRLSLLASYNFGQSTVDASSNSVFSEFTDVQSEETMLGILHQNKKTNIGFIYKEPMRVTNGDVYIQVASQLNGDGSYQYSNGWASLSPDGKERNFEIFYEHKLDNDNKVKINMLKRVEPNHIASSEDDDIVLFSYSKNF